MVRVGIVAFVLFCSTVVLANWLVNEFGLVSVGFGLVAPAGVYAAGLALTLRDVTQRCLGRPWALLAIAIGAAVSALVSPRLALASASAFAVSELADMAVFTRLERHGLTAVVSSNVVGAAIDSALFLTISGIGLQFWSGQMVGKLWMTLAALPVLLLVRRRFELSAPARPRTARA